MKKITFLVLLISTYWHAFAMTKIHKRKSTKDKNYDYGLIVLMQLQSSHSPSQIYYQSAFEYLKQQCKDPRSQCSSFIAQELLKEFNLINSQGKILPHIKQQLTKMLL